MKKKLILLLIVVFFLFFIFHFNYQCPFKYFLHIACPGCGLARSFRAILNLDFYQAFKYNILGIPLFLFIIYSIFIIIKEIIKKQDNYLNNVLLFISKHYIVILFILIINMLINNLRGI